MYRLRIATPQAWVEAVLNNFDEFLVDHAAAEKKASGMAISMLSHYTDKPDIVSAMTDLAIEELTHFREVMRILYQRGLQLGSDTRDAYVNGLRECMRKGARAYLLDRLLLGSIIEARGCERFRLIAEALPAGDMKKFYRAIAESEARHEDLFLRLAMQYFPEPEVHERLDELLETEAALIRDLPIRATLH